MAYAIMRCAKIKSFGRLAGNFGHCFRERETQNADPARTSHNEHFFAQSAEEAMTRTKLMMPEKIRKNGVLAVEYLMTASPEFWHKATEEQKKAFFEKSVDWLAEKYGREHIVTATVHTDETTPHLTAIVIPIDAKGKLNARSFIGGTRDALSKDQDSYAEAVADLGLVRGIKGSKAKHKEISQWYEELHEADPMKRDLPSLWISPEELKPRKTGFLEKESPLAVSKRISERVESAVHEHLRFDGTQLYRIKDQAKMIQLQREQLEGQSRALRAAEREAANLKAVFEGIKAVIGYEKLKQIWQEYLRRQQETEKQRQRQAEAREQREQDCSRSSGRGR
ncbi:MAG: MobV family relaxase [Prevotella sp.]|nr:MobV family relaxase [Prevotella sp.]